MDPGRETARIEAFSDGVFAVAITLLVLDLKVPPPGSRGLLAALWNQWPAYLAYMASFATIGIMWINHHRLFVVIRRADHMLLLLNGLLLLGVTFVPYPTAVVVEYIRRADASVAAAVYNGTFTVIAIFFNLLWHYAATGRRLLDHGADPRAISDITRGYRFGPALYLASALLAFVNVAASLLLNIGLAVFFALPRRHHRV